MLRNWSVSWNATFYAPVAASPESWSSALVRLLPVRLQRDTNAGGSAPPLLKKLSIARPTLSWLVVKVGSGDGCAGADWSGKTGSPGTDGSGVDGESVIGGVGVGVGGVGGGVGVGGVGRGTRCAVRLSTTVLPE